MFNNQRKSIHILYFADTSKLVGSFNQKLVGNLNILRPTLEHAGPVWESLDLVLSSIPMFWKDCSWPSQEKPRAQHTSHFEVSRLQVLEQPCFCGGGIKTGDNVETVAWTRATPSVKKGFH